MEIALNDTDSSLLMRVLLSEFRFFVFCLFVCLKKKNYIVTLLVFMPVQPVLAE